MPIGLLLFSCWYFVYILPMIKSLRQVFLIALSKYCKIKWRDPQVCAKDVKKVWEGNLLRKLKITSSCPLFREWGLHNDFKRQFLEHLTIKLINNLLSTDNEILLFLIFKYLKTFLSVDKLWVSCCGRDLPILLSEKVHYCLIVSIKTVCSGTLMIRSGCLNFSQHFRYNILNPKNKNFIKRIE